MARVIKGGAGGGARPARPATRVLAQADLKKVIDKELFVARQEAEELLKKAEEERRAILAEGKRLAGQAREEAMARGASESFARAAEEALGAFRKRAERYQEAADDIRILAGEIVKKILGTEPDLGSKDIENILQRGLAQLRGRRRVRIQLPTGRRERLSFERPNLMKAVAAQPDLVVEEADDVRLGFARVVTEVGGALCAEESALDAVALAVNVKEIPRARADRDGGGTDAHIRMQRGAITDNAETGHESDPVDGRRADPHDVPNAAVHEDDDLSLPSELPEARVEEVDADEDDDDTRALPAIPRSAPRPAAAATPGAPHRGRDPQATTAPMALPTAAPRLRPRGADDGFADRVPTGRVQASGRAATRVLAVDERDALVETARRGGPTRADLGADDDDDMELFTDDRPPRRR